MLAVLPVAAGPALTRVAPRGAGAVHAGRDMLAGVQVTRVHALSSKVPCGDRPASHPPQGPPLPLQPTFWSQTLDGEVSQTVHGFPKTRLPLSPCRGRAGAPWSHREHKCPVGGTWKCREGRPGHPGRAEPCVEGPGHPGHMADRYQLSRIAAPQNSEAITKHRAFEMCTFHSLFPLSCALRILPTMPWDPSEGKTEGHTKTRGPTPQL